MNTSLPTSFASDIEVGAGALPLDAILSALDANEGEWSKLSALHGPFGKWSDIRKAKLATIALGLREKDPPAGAMRWTDDLLDKAAHANVEYLTFLDQSTIEHARYLELNAMRDALIMKYNRGQSLLRYAARINP